MVVHPGNVAETTVTIKTINVLHIFLTDFEIEDVKVFLYTRFGDGFRNDNDATLNLLKQEN